MTNRLTPKEFETWRRQLSEDSDGEFDTTLAHQLVAKLMVEVEMLWGERACTRAEALDQAARALEKRLRDLGRRGALVHHLPAWHGEHGDAWVSPCGVRRPFPCTCTAQPVMLKAGLVVAQ